MQQVKPMPAGCSQQGRYDTRDWPDTVPTDYGSLHPAECCTEIGAEPDPYEGTHLVQGLCSAIAITAIIAAVVAVAV